jgi:hypothetical protein
MQLPWKKTTPNPVYGFEQERLPYTHSKDFMVVSTMFGDMRCYGVMNRLTGHIELMFSQLSAAVINMQTAQQTLDRVRTGEANGFFDAPASQG